LDGGVLVLLGLGAVGMVVVALFGVRRIGRVNKASAWMAALAARNGWRYERDNVRWVALLGGLVVRQSMYARQGQARNVVTAQVDGATVVMFHTITFNRGTRRDVQDNTLWVSTLPLSLPSLTVAPNDLVGRALNAMLGNVRTGDAAFDNQYAVDTADPAFATALLNPAVRQLIMQAGRVAWRIEANHRCLMLWCGGHVTDEATLVGYARYVVAMNRTIVGSLNRT
jgi:hypothetical protein